MLQIRIDCSTSFTLNFLLLAYSYTQLSVSSTYFSQGTKRAKKAGQCLRNKGPQRRLPERAHFQLDDSAAQQKGQIAVVYQMSSRGKEKSILAVSCGQCRQGSKAYKPCKRHDLEGPGPAT